MNIFEKIEIEYNIKLTKDPIRLHGGFMHKMYKLETAHGNYAVKLLNEFVMQRENVMENYALAEKLELLLEKNNIPILPALTFYGRKMQEIDGQYFYIFDYYPGKPLTHKKISEYHCAEMGKLLAKIHNIDKKVGKNDFREISIDWDFYLAEMKKANAYLYEMLKDNYSLIIESQNAGNRSRKKLPDVLAICHNDMDCKNVLWNGHDYRVIDLECLAYSNPLSELFELALCWSGYEECQIDFRLFKAFLQGYANSGGQLPSDWETLYDCNNGRLEWLEYNIKRVLGIDCGEDEKEIGIRQVEETIQHIAYYAKMKERILENCIL